MIGNVVFDRLESLPSLREGWVRLVHRCVADWRVDNIKKNGLIFNKQVAGLPWNVRGGRYNHPDLMATAHNEESFWLIMQKDDMGCFDDNRTAGAKIILDMPLDEYLFLQVCGKKVKGKIDSKYIVGCVENVNAGNKSLKLPIEEVRKAEKISQNNPPSAVVPNNLEEMKLEFISKYPPERAQSVRKLMEESILREKEDFLYSLKETIEMTKLVRATGLTPVQIRKMPAKKREKILQEYDPDKQARINQVFMECAKSGR